MNCPDWECSGQVKPTSECQALGRKSHHKLLSVQFCSLSLGFWFRVFLKLEKITVSNAPAFSNPPQKIRTCLKMFLHVQSLGVK